MDTKSIFRTIGYKDRLVDRVVEEIQQMIIDKKLEPGMKLPPEREFAEQMGVSRTVVREAVQILDTKGLLQVKHGVGTLVREMGSAQINEPITMLFQTRGITLENLHQVRTILEVEIAGIAANNASSEEIVQLEEVLSNLEKSMNNSVEFALGDTAFHHSLVNICHNPLLIMVLDSVGGLMQEVRLSISNYPDLFKTVMPDHREILDSIRSKDAPRARKAMRNHLENARKIQQMFLKDKESAENHQ